MNSGFVPAWRKMFEPEHWLAPDKRSPAGKWGAWLYICQLATHKEREHRGEPLGVGEFVASQRTLARVWGWSLSRVNRFISELNARTAIETLRETPYGTVYRIVNYETYAILENTERNTNGNTERNTSGTLAEQEQPLNPSTIGKTDGSQGDGSGIRSRFPERPKKVGREYDYPPEFEEAWSNYPPRQGDNPKMGAYKEFRRTVLRGNEPSDLVDAARNYADYAKASGKDGTEYVKHASTFYGPQEPWMGFREPMKVSTNGKRPKTAADAHARLKAQL